MGLRYKRWAEGWKQMNVRTKKNKKQTNKNKKLNAMNGKQNQLMKINRKEG